MIKTALITAGIAGLMATSLSVAPASAKLRDAYCQNESKTNTVRVTIRFELVRTLPNGYRVLRVASRSRQITGKRVAPRWNAPAVGKTLNAGVTLPVTVKWKLRKGGELQQCTAFMRAL